MTILVLSDIHLGNGDGYDIFAGGGVLPGVLDDAARERARVFLNGDTFDFLMNEDPLELDAERAAGQARAIVRHGATAEVLAALGRVLAAGGEVTIRLGNHDAEVALAEVQAILRGALGQPDAIARRLEFQRGDGPAIVEVGGAKVLLAHGEHNDPWNRIDYSELPEDGSAPRFRYPPGSRLVKTLLNPLKRRFGMRFADLLKPDFQGAVLTALAVDPGALRLVFGGNTAVLLWQLFRKTQEGHTFAGDEEGEDLGLARALADASLSGDEVEALEAVLDPTTPASFSDEGLLGGARVKLARAGMKLYAAAQRALTGAAGERYFGLAPDDAEWTEARRLAQRFGADAVVLGHTHSARWRQEADLLFVNTGTWIHLMRLPAAKEDEGAWQEFLELVRRNPGLDPGRGPAAPLYTRFTGLKIAAAQGGGAELQLCEWRAGGAPEVLASGRVAKRR